MVYEHRIYNVLFEACCQYAQWQKKIDIVYCLWWICYCIIYMHYCTHCVKPCCLGAAVFLKFQTFSYSILFGLGVFPDKCVYSIAWWYNTKCCFLTSWFLWSLGKVNISPFAVAWVFLSQLIIIIILIMWTQAFAYIHVTV